MFARRSSSSASLFVLSHTSIRQIWTAFALQPRRAETFKLSTDPEFVDKVRDIVGLYLSPPDQALVLCVDEKSQIQALDREQPVLPGGVVDAAQGDAPSGLYTIRGAVAHGADRRQPPASLVRRDRHR